MASHTTFINSLQQPTVSLPPSQHHLFHDYREILHKLGFDGSDLTMHENLCLSSYHHGCLLLTTLQSI